MKCPACGHANAEGGDHCERCGAELDDGAMRTFPPVELAVDPPSGAEPSEAPTVAGESTPLPAAGRPGAELGPGARLGNRYEITAMLGKGGMGIVYRARDLRLQRDVALKVIRPELLEDPQIAERFRREILLASKITHRNVLRIHDLGESDGMSYISMAYVEGETLSQRLEREGPLSPERTVETAIQLCHALAAAHEAGVVHRDLKPQNILIDRQGQVYVGDFGISRSLESGDTMTQDGAVLGTLHYMAPEQARGETPDHRADIYSLGMVMYRMLLGKLPFDRGSSITAVLRRVQQDVPDVRTQRADVPPWLSAVVARALRREPAERYQSASELREDLERQSARAARGGLPRPRTLALGAAAVAVLALLVLGLRQGLPLLRASRKARASRPVAVLAILPTVNATGDAAYDWAGAGVAELLRTDLLQSPELRLIEGARLGRVLDGMKVDSRSAVRPEVVPSVARLVGADRILATTLERDAQGLRIDARLETLSGGTVARTESLVTRGAGEDALASLVDELSKGVRDDLHVALADDRGAADQSSGSVEALKRYAEGLERLRAHDLEQAAQRFTAALDADPQFALARAALAETESAMGRTKEAETESRRAAQDAARLTPHEAARVRALAARLSYDLERAELALRDLVAAFPNSAEGWFELGVVQEQREELPQATVSVRRAIELDPAQAQAQFALGRLQAKAGHVAEALAQFRTAEAQFLEARDDDGRASVLYGMGNVYSYDSRYDEALRSYDEALALRRKLGDRAGTAQVLFGSALVREAQGRVDEAIEQLREVVRLLEQTGERARLAEAHLTLGDFLQGRGRPDEALKAYEDGMTILLDVGDPSGVARALSGVAYTNMVLGNYAQAGVILKDALEKRRQIGDKLEICISLSEVGTLEQIQGRYEKALEYQQEGLSLSQAVRNLEGVVVFSVNLANIDEDRGSYGAALELLARAEQTAREIDEPNLLATSLIYTGSTRGRLGDLDGALQALDAALALARKTDNRQLVAKALAYRSAVLALRGDSASARATAREALDLARETKDHRLQVIARLAAGTAERSTSELEAVAAEAEASKLLPLVAPARLELARLHLGAGRAPRALDEARAALAAAEPLGQVDYVFQARHVSGLALAATRQADEARKQFLAALDALRALRTPLTGPTLEHFLSRRETVAFGQDAANVLAGADAQALSTALAGAS